MAEIKFATLTVDNVFDFCTVLDAIGAESCIAAFDPKEIAAMQNEGKNENGIGVAIAMKVLAVVLKNLPKARTEIYDFFANCTVWDNGTAVTADEIKKFKPGQFIKLIKDFMQTEDLTDFFKEVAGLMGLEQNSSTNLSIEDTMTAATT